MVKGSSERYRQSADTTSDKLVPEGVEGRVAFKGPLGPFVYQLVGGLRAGMGYCGTPTIEGLRTEARFVQVSPASVRESHPHDIAITQEAPKLQHRAPWRRRVIDVHGGLSRLRFSQQSLLRQLSWSFNPPSSLKPMRASFKPLMSRIRSTQTLSRSVIRSASPVIATNGCPISRSRRRRRPNHCERKSHNTPPPVAPQTTEGATPHPLEDPFGDRAIPQPLLPNVQDLLADDTNKKLPSDALLTPPDQDMTPLKEEPTDKLPALDLGESTDLPTTDELLVDKRQKRTTECKSPDDILYSIEELDYTTEIRDTSIADPDNRPRTCDLASGDFVPRQWAPTTFMWQASGLCHKPAYFEDVHLERYGHSWGPYVQPLMSGAHFFLNVPILPYKMGTLSAQRVHLHTRILSSGQLCPLHA